MNWCGCGASVTGPRHKRRQEPNQDAWLVRHYSWGDVAVVCDGIGSCTHGKTGAMAACKAVCKAATQWARHPLALPDDVLRLVHAHWLLHISPLPPRDCGTTCLLTIRCHGQLLVARLGDGMIVLLGAMPHILAEENKEFLNITSGLGKTFSLEHWQWTLLPCADDYNAVLLCTDGIADDIAAHLRIDFARDVIINHVPYTAAKRASLLYRCLQRWPVPHHSDDKTLVFLFEAHSIPSAHNCTRDIS